MRRSDAYIIKRVTDSQESRPMSHKITSIVTRRQAVGMAGAAGASLLLSRISGPDRLLESLGVSDVAQAAATSCVLTPDKTEGPYFVDEKLNRSDIRADPTDGSVQPGTPVSLTMVVVRADGNCAAVSGAAVDIWHANAAGKYSDIASEGSSGKKYLRGVQVTDANGQAKFTTVYPGWYQGRAVHIHFKVRLFDGTSKTYEFTSQLFFDPATTSAVYQTGVYAARGQASTANASDGIYGSDGSKLVVALTPDGNGGYAGTFVVGLSGLPGTTGTGSGTGNTVGAAIASARFRRSTAGRRILRVTSTLTETADVTARLSRSGTTLVRKSASGLAAGSRAMDLRVPLRAPGGKARLTVVYIDAAGLKKTIARTVTVPRKTL
jgi:protocatechuate 3,4-dioxygenase beta subunit